MEIKQFYKKFNTEWQKQLESWKTKPTILSDTLCQKCGGELGTRSVGDESYDYCSDCNCFNF